MDVETAARTRIRLPKIKPEDSVHAVVVGGSFQSRSAVYSAIAAYRAWLQTFATSTLLAEDIEAVALSGIWQRAILECEGPHASAVAEGDTTGAGSLSHFRETLVHAGAMPMDANASRHCLHPGVNSAWWTKERDEDFYRAQARMVTALASAKAKDADNDNIQWYFVCQDSSIVNPTLLPQLISDLRRFGDPKMTRIRVGSRVRSSALNHAVFSSRAGFLVSKSAVDAIDWSKVLKAQRTCDLGGLPSDLRLEHIFGERLSEFATELTVKAELMSEIDGHTGPYKGVHTKIQPDGTVKYVAKLAANGHLQDVGVFDDEVDAARAHDEAATKARRPKSRLNFGSFTPEVAVHTNALASGRHGQPRRFGTAAWNSRLPAKQYVEALRALVRADERLAAATCDDFTCEPPSEEHTAAKGCECPN